VSILAAARLAAGLDVPIDAIVGLFRQLVGALQALLDEPDAYIIVKPEPAEGLRHASGVAVSRAVGAKTAPVRGGVRFTRHRVGSVRRAGKPSGQGRSSGGQPSDERSKAGQAVRVKNEGRGVGRTAAGPLLRGSDKLNGYTYG